MMRTSALQFAAATLLCVAGGLMLAACDNQYGPPVPGRPLTWGQQHYLDNQRYQQLTNDRINN